MHNFIAVAEENQWLLNIEVEVHKLRAGLVSQMGFKGDGVEVLTLPR